MPDLDSLRRALRRSPGNTALLLLYGQRCLDDLQFTEARQAFERLLTLEPTHDEAQLGIARVLFLDGKTSEAAVRVERILREHPDYAPAHLFLSRIHLAENNRSKALEEYHKALAVDSAIGDPGLEKELGRGGRPPRRAPAPVGSDPRHGGHGHSHGFPDEDALDDEHDFDEEGDWRTEHWFQPAPIEPGPLSFASIGGLERVKTEVRSRLLDPLKDPTLFRAYGQQAAGGILLYGPPGCGKSLVSRAIAGESRAKVFPIGIHDLFDSYIGNTEKNLRYLFETARQQAPSVLFFDEFDSFAPDRRRLRDPQMRNVVNQLLAELDAIHSPGSEVLVMAATNTPWALDPQCLRPGRFDRTLFVPPPDNRARRRILKRLLEDKPTDRIDLQALADASRGLSGADLRGWVERASHAAISDAMSSGQLVPLTTDLLLKLRPDIKSTCRGWFHEAREQVKNPRTREMMADFMRWLDKLGDSPRSLD